MSTSEAQIAEAERLECATLQAIDEFRLSDAIASAASALDLRERVQGGEHPDTIWTLSLWIEALRQRHTLANAQEAARLGERRLERQVIALREAPAELAHALRRQIALYHFEETPFDADRVAQLRRQLKLTGSGGRRGG